MPAELASTLTAASDDDLLLQAEATVRAYCGWHIAPERSEDVTVDPAGSPVLLLPTLHLVSVNTITVDGDVVDPATVVWSATGYLYRYTDTSHAYPQSWGTLPRSVVLNVTHGYTAPPASVTGVVQALASRAKSNPAGLVARTRGPFGDTYATDLLATERISLSAYKLPPRS